MSIRSNISHALAYMEQVFHTVVEEEDSRKIIYKHLINTNDALHENVYVQVNPPKTKPWHHTTQLDNKCDHKPNAPDPHTTNFMQNIKSLLNEYPSLHDHLLIFQIKIFSQSNSLRTNASLSHFVRTTPHCPICREGRDDLRLHNFKSCSPVLTAKKKIAVQLKKPYLGKLSPLVHALAHSPMTMYSKLVPPRTSRRTRPKKQKSRKSLSSLSPISLHILHIIKINYAIWNVRCYLNKLPQFYPPEQVTDLLAVNMIASIQNPDYYKPIMSNDPAYLSN